MANRRLAGAGRLIAMCGLIILGFGACALNAATMKKSLLHKAAPRFTRKDLDGRAVRLHAYRGKVVLLNFWATWCGPCEVELPRFVVWQRQYGSQGLQVIAVSMDDRPEPVRGFVRKLNPDFPVVMGDEKIGTLYGGVLGLPVTFLISRDGKIAERIEGESDLGLMERHIQRLLARQAD